MARSLCSTEVLREITRGLVSDLEAAIARITELFGVLALHARSSQ